MLMNSVREQILNSSLDLGEFLMLFPTKTASLPTPARIRVEIETWEKNRWKQHLRHTKKERRGAPATFASKQELLDWVYTQPEILKYLQSYLYALSIPDKKLHKKFIPVIHRVDKKLFWTKDNMRIGVNHNSADQRKYLKIDPKKSKKPETRQVFIIPIVTTKQGTQLEYSKMIFCSNTSKAQRLLKISHKNYIADKLHESETQCPETAPSCIYKNFLIKQKMPAPTLF